MKFFSTLIAATIGSLIALGVVFLFALLFLVGLAASSGETPRVRSGSVLVMNLAGSIPERVSGDPLSQALTGEPDMDLWDVKRSLEHAANDDRIQALWIRIESASTPWVVAREIRKSLATFKESGKPIIASSDDFPITEDEYFLASVADKIYSGPEAFFEFNGFYISAAFYKRLLEKLDIEPLVVRAGNYKSAVEPYLRESLSEENALQLQTILDTQERLYVESIASDRGMEPAAVGALLDDFGLASSEEAYQAGLVDGVKHRDEVEDEIRLLLDLDEDDELRTVTIATYRRAVPRAGGRTSRDEVAVVYASGTIVSGSTAGRVDQVGSKTFRRAMEQARESDRVKAVVVRVDSPGGSASASDAMLRTIAETREDKPVVVSMGAVAASGGYWISMEADSIIADPLTITGSIGVYSLFFDIGDLYQDKLGVDFETLRTGPSADMLSGLRPYTDAERQQMQSAVDRTYAAFLEKVSANRKLPVDRVEELAGGRVWTGVDARERGLVDELGGLDDALAIAADRAGLEEDAFRVRLLPRSPTFLDRFNRLLDEGVATLVKHRPMPDVDRRALERLREFKSLIDEIGTVQARLPYIVRVES